MVIPTHRLGAGGGAQAVRHERRSALRSRRGATTAAATREPAAISLDDAAARSVEVVGAKAANLARATAAGLPVIAGFAVPTSVVARASAAGGFAALPVDLLDDLHKAWRSVTGEGLPLVVRSSAVSEDAEGSSMAGRFESVLAVRGWRPFLNALETVAASASVIALDGTDAIERHDMGIVVQRFLPAASGGVLFGVDPVSGRTDRLALATVAGGPDALVSGEASGVQQVLGRRGRALETRGDRTLAPPLRRRVQLAAMARHAAALFGAPQDIEWALDGDGGLWLLQSRPVTTVGAVGSGPLFGPGPVAETFPDPLTRLEQDLWLEPLRIGIAHAIDMTGVAPARRLAASPVAIAVGGRVAIDLEIIGATGQKRSFWRAVDPRPGARRLRAAWRTGRLRRASPALVDQLVTSVDEELSRVPQLGTVDDRGLLGVLRGTRRLLVALHGQEVLAGLLLDGRAVGTSSGAGEALRDLAQARRDGVPAERIVMRHPTVLALVPPAVRPVTVPPIIDAGVEPDASSEARDAGEEIGRMREALRMRVRWVQELGALAAWEAGCRLVARGALAAPDDVGMFSVDELEHSLGGNSVTVVPERISSAPLPSMFRLDGAGRPVAVALAGTETPAGQGAGGGRKIGRVVHDPSEIDASEPTVLVTQTLSPALAAALPRLAGLVAETGGVLSHLAILARELGVATVVGVSGAGARFAAGEFVVVDGASGTVEVVERAR